MIRGFWLYGTLVVLLQALVACGQPTQSTNGDAVSAKSDAAAPKAAEAAYDRLVVVFGDSLYAGYRLAPNESLAPQLQAALKTGGINARVHNAGVSGDTTAAGKTRLAFVLDNLERKPDLLVLGLGGNDMLRGTKPEQTRANMAAMLDELKKRDIPVVLTGMLASPNMGTDYSDAFNPIFPELARRYNTPLYPFFLEGVVTNNALMLPDGVHPNAKGVSRVVEGLSPLVEAALKAKN